MGTEATSRPREGGAVHTLRFGVFEMDVRSGELRRNGALVRLQPQPFKVLALLASRPGDVVTREEIQAEVWPAGTFVDFEQSLNFCVRQIRSALGDSAISPRYVETLPRRGYRWVGGAVERVGPPATVHEWPRPVPAEPTNGTGAEAPAEAPPPRPRHRFLLAVAAVLAVTAVATGWLALRRPPELPPPDFQRVTFRRGAVMSARFGPEQQVVYVASWEDQPWGMHVVSVGARESRLLDIDRASVVAASASEVAFIRGYVLARAPLAGGPPREVAQGVVAADWTSDTSEFAIVRAEKGRLHLEYPIGHDLGETAANRLRLSPDGTMIALGERVMLGDDRGRVVVVDRDGHQLVATDEFASLEGIAWAPSGDEVWFTAAKVGAESELHALTLDGKVRTIFSAMGRLVVHDVAPDGRVLLERTAFRAETFFHRDGEGADRDLSWLDVSGVAGITADGSAILLVESGEGGGPDYTSYLRRTDGALPVKLGPGRGTSLSPDGKRALVIPLRNPDHVEVVPVGPGEPRSVRIPGVLRYDHAGWLPDGRSFYVSTRDAQWRWSSWIVDAGGGEPRKVPLPEGRTLVFDPFSPDGSRFVAPCLEKRLTCVYDTVKGEPHPLPGASEEYYPIKWDAKGIYLRDRRHEVPDILRRLDPRTGKIEVLGELVPRDPAGALGIGHVVVADGGDAWAYSVLRRLSDLYVVTGLH